MSVTRTQNEQILSHLKRGWGITPRAALEKYGSFRLAARIYELRNNGWNIETRHIDAGNGRTVAEYYLVK